MLFNSFRFLWKPGHKFAASVDTRRAGPGIPEPRRRQQRLCCSGFHATNGLPAAQGPPAQQAHSGNQQAAQAADQRESHAHGGREAQQGEHQGVGSLG